MRIDAHQHFWHYDPAEYGWISEAMPDLRRDRLPPDLQPELEKAGFDACIAVQARQTEAETDFLLELSGRYDFVRGVVGWVDLQDPAVEQRLRHYRSFKRLCGFRHIVQDEPDDRFLLREAFIRGLRHLFAEGFSYDILVYEKHLPVVVEFLDHFDDSCRFVLDHIGKPVVPKGVSAVWRDSIRAIAAHPNVYCKLSGLVTEADWNNWKPSDFYPFLDIVLEAFGPDRLMLGSDWPVCLLAADHYGEVVEVVRQYLVSLPEADQENIFGRNAARFYQLD